MREGEGEGRGRGRVSSKPVIGCRCELMSHIILATSLHKARPKNVGLVSVLHSIRHVVSTVSISKSQNMSLQKNVYFINR